jgi:hypothetical protein
MALQRFWTLLLALIATIVGKSASADNERPFQSLCEPMEKTIFSCGFENNRLVSICASTNVAKEDGYVEYRYGKLGAIELSLPNKKTPPNKALKGTFQDFFRSSGNWQAGNHKAVTFTNGNYSYTVEKNMIFSRSAPDYSDETAKLYVRKNGESIAEKYCVTETVVDNFPELNTLKAWGFDLIGEEYDTEKFLSLIQGRWLAIGEEQLDSREVQELCANKKDNFELALSIQEVGVDGFSFGEGNFCRFPPTVVRETSDLQFKMDMICEEMGDLYDLLDESFEFSENKQMLNVFGSAGNLSSRYLRCVN